MWCEFGVGYLSHVSGDFSKVTKALLMTAALKEGPDKDQVRTTKDDKVWKFSAHAKWFKNRQHSCHGQRCLK